MRNQNKKSTALISEAGLFSYPECNELVAHWHMKIQTTDSECLKLIDQNDLFIAFVTRGIAPNDLRELIRVRHTSLQLGIVAGREEVKRQFRSLIMSGPDDSMNIMSKHT